MPVRIHAAVQDSDDMNSIRRHRVMDSVTAYKQHAVPVAHVVALHPDLGIIRQLPDAAVQPIEILVRLDLVPLLVARAKDSIADASKKTNSAPTHFAAAYSAAFGSPAPHSRLAVTVPPGAKATA